MIARKRDLPAGARRDSRRRPSARPSRESRRRLFGEADHPRDLRAALATDREDALAAAARPEQREPAKAPQLRDQPAAAADVCQAYASCRAAPPVAQPDGALDFLIVAAEQVVHDGRVARAAGVLQQQRVQKSTRSGGRRPQGLGDAKADRAVARRGRAGDPRSDRARVRARPGPARRAGRPSSTSSLLRARGCH